MSLLENNNNLNSSYYQTKALLAAKQEFESLCCNLFSKFLAKKTNVFIKIYVHVTMNSLKLNYHDRRDYPEQSY